MLQFCEAFSSVGLAMFCSFTSYYWEAKHHSHLCRNDPKITDVADIKKNLDTSYEYENLNAIPKIIKNKHLVVNYYVIAERPHRPKIGGGGRL